MDIMKFIEEKLEDPDIIGKLTGASNVNAKKVEKAAKLSIPAMVKGLALNTKSKEGMKSLDNVLDNHKEDNIMDIKGFLQNVNKDEGEKILVHMFGNNKDKIQSNIAKESGLQENQIANIMKQLAPLLLGILGQKSKNESLGSNITSVLLGNIVSGNDSGIMGTVTSLLEKDGAGSIIGNVSDIAGKLFKK